MAGHFAKKRVPPPGEFCFTDAAIAPVQALGSRQGEPRPGRTRTVLDLFNARFGPIAAVQARLIGQQAPRLPEWFALPNEMDQMRKVSPAPWTILPEHRNHQGATPMFRTEIATAAGP